MTDTSPLKFDCTLNPDDIAEVLRPPFDSDGKKRRSPATALIGWLAFTAMFAVWILFSSHHSISLSDNLNQQETVYPPGMDDLWLTLIPALMPAGFFALIWTWMLVSAARAKPAGMTTTPAGKGAFARIAQVIVFVSIIGSARLLMSSSMALPWAPTREKILMVSLGPWLVLVIVIVVLSPLNRRLQVRKAWQTNPWLQRPKSIEIDNNGVTVIDQFTSSRYLWTYLIRYSETSRLLLLQLEDGRKLPLPKRAVDEQTLMRLRAMISDKIANGKFWPVNSTFEVVLARPVIPVAAEGDATPR